MKKYTFSYAEISSAWIRDNDDRAVVISWGSPGIGWGEVTLIQPLEEDSVVFIDDESMGRDFVKALLGYMVDNAKLGSDPRKA